jgi:hypothetical protein
MVAASRNVSQMLPQCCRCIVVVLVLPASGLVACLVMFSAHAKAGELPEQSTGFAYSNRLRSEVVSFGRL